LTQRRVQASRVIQRVYRGFRGRASFRYTNKVQLVLLVQKWMRIKWAKMKLRAFVKMVRRIQSFQRRTRARLGMIRRHLGMRDQALELTAGMKELSKVMEMDELFDDTDTHMHEQRLQLAKYLDGVRHILRRAYLKYSMILVSQPEKAFQMSRPQFGRFVKDAGLLGKGSDIDNNVIEEIFNKCNMDLKVKRPKGTEEATKKAPSKDTGKAVANEQQVMMPDEFVEAVIRLTNRVCGPKKIRPLHRRLEYMFNKHFTGIAYDVDYSAPTAPGLNVPGSEATLLIERYQESLPKLFAHYNGGDDSIDCVEWMLMCKDCKIIDASTSFSKIMDLFVRCNQEELEEYFTCMEDPENIREMSLEFDEFLQAIVATAYLSAGKKKTDTFGDKLQHLIEKMLSQVLKTF